MKINIDDNVVDEIVAEFLKSRIRDEEIPGHDPHETPDNKAALLSSLYRVLEYCTTHDEYQEFLLTRK